MALEKWQSECVERLPEIVDEEFEPWATPGMMWIDLLFAFEDAYKPPQNDEFIRRVYEFAAWCAEQPTAEKTEDDLFTVVGCGFYEHLADTPEMLRDIPRYMSKKQVENLVFFFTYRHGEVGYQKILYLFKDPN